MSPGLQLKSEERDMGALLDWNCPKCEKEQVYHLVSLSTSISLLGINGLKSTDLLDVRCASCGYEVQVKETPPESLEKLHALTARYHAGELTREAYREAVQEVPGQLVSDIRAVAEEWACPKCEESSPVSFLECWNCGYDRNPEQFPDDDDDNQPPDHGRIKHGGSHPWER